jgi:hypothetical protein
MKAVDENSGENTAKKCSSNQGPCSNTRYSRIFKKVSQDGNLVLFLPQRELMVTENRVEALMGVALIHENVMKVKDINVYLQVILIFRYINWLELASCRLGFLSFSTICVENYWTRLVINGGQENTYKSQFMCNTKGFINTDNELCPPYAMCTQNSKRSYMGRQKAQLYAT